MRIGIENFSVVQHVSEQKLPICVAYQSLDSPKIPKMLFLIKSLNIQKCIPQPLQVRNPTSRTLV